MDHENALVPQCTTDKMLNRMLAIKNYLIFKRNNSML